MAASEVILRLLSYGPALRGSRGRGNSGGGLGDARSSLGRDESLLAHVERLEGVDGVNDDKEDGRGNEGIDGVSAERDFLIGA